MGTTTEKLQYTLDSVNDMQTAFTEIGVSCPDTDELATYGDKIRTLSTMKIYSKYCNITAGTWSGVTLSNNDWVNLCTANKSSEWTYYFEEEIDISKIQFVSANFTSNSYIRITRGYKINSNTLDYQYISSYSVYGNKNTNQSANKGGLEISNSLYVHTETSIDNYSGTSSNSETGEFRVFVYKNRITFQFCYNKRGVGGIKTTTPQFSFAIGYTS